MTRLERWTLLGSSVVVAATGLAYAWMKYLIAPPDPFAVVNHPLQPLMLKLHILSAPVMVFALGMVALRHVWAHLRAGRVGRRSGLPLLVIVVPLVATGYLLQTATGSAWLAALGYGHLALGAGYTVFYAVHHVTSRRRRERASARRAAAR